MNTERLIVEGVKHEIAHALVGPGHGHDSTWRRMALIVGCQPVHCATNAIMPSAPWVGVCPKCRILYPMFRRPKPGRPRWCKNCGPINGILTFTASEDAGRNVGQTSQ